MWWVLYEWIKYLWIAKLLKQALNRWIPTHSCDMDVSSRISLESIPRKCSIIAVFACKYLRAWWDHFASNKHSGTGSRFLLAVVSLSSGSGSFVGLFMILSNFLSISLLLFKGLPSFFLSFGQSFARCPSLSHLKQIFRYDDSNCFPSSFCFVAPSIVARCHRKKNAVYRVKSS